MPLAEKLDRFEVETVYKVEFYKPFNSDWRFNGDFVNPTFKKNMARRQLHVLVQYVNMRRTSSCCKRSWKHTAHTKPQYLEGAWLKRKYI